MAVESPIEAKDSWFTGEDKVLRFTVYGEGEVVENVTGWTFEWKLYKRRESATALVTKTVGAGVTVTNGPGGQVSIVVAAADTAALVDGSYAYVFRRTNAGASQVLAYGGVALRSAVLA